MPTTYMVVPYTPGATVPEMLQMQEGESLEYENGTVEVMRDTTTFQGDYPAPDPTIIKIVPVYDSEDPPELIGYNVTRRNLTEVPRIMGGYDTNSQAPPDDPPDFVRRRITTTEDMINTLDARLFAIDAILGRSGEIMEDSVDE